MKGRIELPPCGAAGQPDSTTLQRPETAGCECEASCDLPAAARAKIEAWRIDYNRNRPYSSLGHLTPSEFIHNRQVTRIREAAEL